jgi:hypothetical protein
MWLSGVTLGDIDKALQRGRRCVGRLPLRILGRPFSFETQRGKLASGISPITGSPGGRIWVNF